MNSRSRRAAGAPIDGEIRRAPGFTWGPELTAFPSSGVGLPPLTCDVGPAIVVAHWRDPGVEPSEELVSGGRSRQIWIMDARSWPVTGGGDGRGQRYCGFTGLCGGQWPRRLATPPASHQHWFGAFSGIAPLLSDPDGAALGSAVRTSIRPMRTSGRSTGRCRERNWAAWTGGETEISPCSCSSSPC
jgi:hypothetical protein